jgi:hypothetical protein
VKSVKKTVDEIIESHPDTVFYVGTVSSYFFIGDREEWRKRRDLVNGHCMRKFDAAQYEARSNIPKLLKTLTVLTSARKIDRNTCMKRIADLQKYIIDLSQEWQNIGNRIPVKIYRKEGEDGVALIVQGLEGGGFWLKEEYDAKYRKGR